MGLYTRRRTPGNDKPWRRVLKALWLDAMTPWVLFAIGVLAMFVGRWMWAELV